MKWVLKDNGKAYVEYVLSSDASPDTAVNLNLDALIRASTKVYYAVLTGKSDPAGKVRYSIKVTRHDPKSTGQQLLYEIYERPRHKYQFFVYQEGDLADKEQLYGTMDFIFSELKKRMP